MKKSFLVLGIGYFGSTVAADMPEEPSSEIFQGKSMAIESTLNKRFSKTDPSTLHGIYCNNFYLSTANNGVML